MKTLFSVLFIMLLMACQPKTELQPVDTSASETAVNALADRYHGAICNKTSGELENILTDSGWYCGTDPSEIWRKDTLIKALKQTEADTSLKIDYTIDKRITMVAPDGKSAVVLDQTIISLLSDKIPARYVFHLMKDSADWKIDFMSLSFIPKNEDISTLNKALK